MKRYYVFFVVLAILSLGAAGLETVLHSGTVDDQRTESDFDIIQSTIGDAVLDNNVLPSSLSSLQLDADVAARAKKSYRYQVLDKHSYQLCATFKHAHNMDNTEASNPPTYTDTTRHPAGQWCELFVVDLQDTTPSPLPVKTPLQTPTTTPTKSPAISPTAHPLNSSVN